MLIAIEDFQTRTISVWKLIVCALLSILYDLAKIGILQIGKNFLFNGIFIVVQLLFVMLYFSLKKKRFINVLDSYLGLGDAVFFILIGLLLGFEYFVLFYLLSVLIVLFTSFIYIAFNKNEHILIPLAGGQAICLILLLIWGKLYEVNFYENFFSWL